MGVERESGKRSHMRPYQSRWGQLEDSRTTSRRVLTTISTATLISRVRQVQGCPSPSGSRCRRCRKWRWRAAPVSASAGRHVSSAAGPASPGWLLGGAVSTGDARAGTGSAMNRRSRTSRFMAAACSWVGAGRGTSWPVFRLPPPNPPCRFPCNGLSRTWPCSPRVTPAVVYPFPFRPAPELHPGRRSPGVGLPQVRGCQAPAALPQVAGFPDRGVLWRLRRSPGFSSRLLGTSVSGEPLTFLMMDSAESFRRRFYYRPKPLFAESRPSAG